MHSPDRSTRRPANRQLMPPFLSPGDQISVVAPCGSLSLSQLESLEHGVKIWRDRGYKLDRPEFAAWGYLAGRDDQRRSQLLAAWQDPNTTAILVAKGGYGAMRLLEQWSWQELAPKWLIGFSDVTALLWSMAASDRAGGLHGDLLTTLATQPPWVIEQMFGWLEGKLPQVTLAGQGWGGGKGQGKLLAANLNLATHLIGTPHFPAWQKPILAIEEVGELPYQVDRMLTHWRLTGLIQQLGGIALGRFSHPPLTKPSLTMTEVLRDRLGDLNIPIVADLPFGHQGENAPLPLGYLVELDGDLGTLTIRS
ncbi:MAG: LD-carboxypeptidase [Pseudanabaenaceae cyanobacterium bins.68]|nr:LD-carboxypeptidase [Pseudanabaenaceae cyanobacterium bins.68]